MAMYVNTTWKRLIVSLMTTIREVQCENVDGEVGWYDPCLDIFVVAEIDF
jgi:hypothetical protein